MSVFYKVRVWESGSLTGTDPTYDTPGVAATGGYRTFTQAAVPTGSLLYLMLVNSSTNAWEYSTWTYTTGTPNTITRVTFIDSSTGAIINWSGVTATIGLEMPPPTLTSSGSVSQGLIPALNATGLLDGSIIPNYGNMLPSTNYYVWPKISPQSSSGNATEGPNSTVRVTVNWKFNQKPLSFGVVCNTASASGNCQIRLYEPTSTYTGGALLYDSGILSTATAGVLMGASISGGISLPSTFIYDFAVDTNGTNAQWVYSNLFEIGGPTDMSAGDTGSFPAISYAVYYTGISSPAPNPCNYDSTVNAYYTHNPPSLMAVF